jgi:serine-type D-Ala-D-Ala carboxypeptidase/endopeptidase
LGKLDDGQAPDGDTVYEIASVTKTFTAALLAKAVFSGRVTLGAALTEAMRVHLAPGHDYTGKAANYFDTDALVGTGAICSTANDMLCDLKANMGVDESPLAAIKLAQQPRHDMNKTMRIGLAWMTTDKGIVWKDGLI